MKKDFEDKPQNTTDVTKTWRKFGWKPLHEQGGKDVNSGETGTTTRGALRDGRGTIGISGSSKEHGF